MEERLKVDARRVAAASAVLAREGGLVEVWAKANPVARRHRLDLARRARDLDLVVDDDALEGLLLRDVRRYGAPGLECLRGALRVVDDVGVGQPKCAAGGAEFVAEDLDAPDVEAEGPADIAARVDVGQDREVAGEFSFLILKRMEPSFSSDLVPRKE